MSTTLTEEEQWDLDDWYYKLEQEWKESQLNWTEWQWATFFADSPYTIRNGMKYRIAQADTKLKQLIIDQRNLRQSDFPHSQQPVIEWQLEEIQKKITEQAMLKRLAKAIIHRYCQPKRKKPGVKLPTTNPQMGITVTYRPKKESVSDLDRDMARQVPLEQFYAGPWKKTGSTWTTRCMFHTDKSPSFTLYKKNNTFYCFGCQVGGDVIEFVEKQQNLSFIEAVKLLLGK